MASPVTAACIIAASQAFSVPVPLLDAVLSVEGGTVGEASTNTNGSRDMGPMQINTIWLADIAKRTGLPESRVEQKLTDDGCFNVRVGAWILSTHIRDTGSYIAGVSRYHSRTPHLGSAYAQRIVAAYKINLLKAQMRERQQQNAQRRR